MAEKNKGKDDSDVRKKLLKELRSLIKDIPEEGLLFLIKQANTILYNMRVDELNKANEKLQRSNNVSKSKKGKHTEKTDFVHSVSIERSSFGRSFILVIDDCRKIMSESEITKIVRIAYGSAQADEGAKRLFTWFKRNRDDIILDAGLNPKHPALQELYTYLLHNFSLAPQNK